MIPSSAIRLRATLTAALVATLLSVAACAPSPHTTPSPTATPLFANKEDAFAAAEVTYRAYTDASNATILTDADTFDPVFAWLRADALDSARKNYSEYYASGVTRTGASSFDHFTPGSYDPEARTVVVRLCIDVSDVDVLDAEGHSVVPGDRPPRRAVEVTMISADTATGLAISSAIPTDILTC
ncbi:hypothetical protein [Microbacterium sp. K41]|uniref:hypothetical protein n=1 Tax=Microbacterium sp. K41 TaxID=2305437 RepID=UPI00109C5E54|nr:hypothetical protein [Microbacterium sp. K41]